MGQFKIATYSDTCKEMEGKLNNPFPEDAVVRLGGTLDYSKYPIQINSKYAVQSSVNKLIVNLLLTGKEYILPFLACYGKFCEGCSTFQGNDSLAEIAGKMYKGQPPRYIIRPLGESGGEGIKIVDSQMKLLQNLNAAIATPYVNVTSEYRFFCTQKEVFYIYKKFKKKDHKQDAYITRGNHIISPIEKCVKPRRLEDMKKACLEVMNAIGLEIGAIDVIYDSSDNDNHRFYIVETNTGPEISTKEIEAAFVAQLEKLIIQKKQNEECVD